MNVPTHPIDPALQDRGWRRFVLNDLRDGSQQAVRFIFLVPARSSGRRMITSIDVNMWTRGEGVQMEFPTDPPSMVRAMMEPLMRRSAQVPPHALGLTPCVHDQHWTPFSLPLFWEQSMNSVSVFGRIVQQYSVLLEDRRWQCPDSEQLIQSFS